MAWRQATALGRINRADGALLADRKVSETRLIFVEVSLVSQLEPKPQVSQLLPTLYPDQVEKTPAEALEEVARIDLLAGHLDSKADLDLANLTGGPELGSLSSILGNYGCLLEACYVVRESAPLLVAEFLSLVISDVDAVSRASILEEFVGAS